MEGRHIHDMRRRRLRCRNLSRGPGRCASRHFCLRHRSRGCRRHRRGSWSLARRRRTLMGAGNLLSSGRHRHRRRGGLLGLGRSRALAQLLARGFASPCARVDVTNDVEPFLRLGEGRKIAHMKSEPLAAFLQAPAHEERKLLQLRDLCLPERHRRRGGAQVEDERTDPRTGSARLSSACDRPGSEFCWCHRFPVQPSFKPSLEGPDSRRGTGVRAFAPGASVAAPPS